MGNIKVLVAEPLEFPQLFTTIGNITAPIEGGFAIIATAKAKAAVKKYSLRFITSAPLSCCVKQYYCRY
jgi:hypothetical protein